MAKPNPHVKTHSVQGKRSIVRENCDIFRAGEPEGSGPQSKKEKRP